MKQLKVVGVFDNANAKQDGELSLRFKFPYSEIGNYTRLLLNIGREMKVLILNEAGEKVPLGNVSLKQLSIDKDGEAKLTVIGDLSQVDMSKLYKLLEQQISFYTFLPVDDEMEVKEDVE